ncbi:MAG: DUF2288 family protein [Myxococcales bacterium]|nr:DUF2288 family protein [Myxococcales bacterium]
MSGGDDDTDGLRARVEATMGPVRGSDLVAHLGRDAVLVVAPALDLVACALAVVRDDAEAVRGWVASGALRKPTATEHAAARDDADARWLAVVVQPYVLVQALAPSAPVH